MIVQLVSIHNNFIAVMMVIYAVEGNDYTPGPYSVRIPAGETNPSFIISIIDDNMYERDESFQLLVDTSSLPEGVIPGNLARAEVTIRNDDGECDVANSW